MCFESFPTITLQTYISLYTNLNINIFLSILISFASISFTFFRVLYADHFSKNRKKEQIIAKRVERKHRTATISATLDFTLNQMFMANPTKRHSYQRQRQYQHQHQQQPSIPSFMAPKPMTIEEEEEEKEIIEFGEEMKVFSTQN